jgi:hypothetical protein
MAREPLRFSTPIVNPDGTPTTRFQQMWQKLDTGGGGGPAPPAGGSSVELDGGDAGGSDGSIIIDGGNA